MKNKTGLAQLEEILAKSEMETDELEAALEGDGASEDDTAESDMSEEDMPMAAKPKTIAKSESQVEVEIAELLQVIADGMQANQVVKAEVEATKGLVLVLAKAVVELSKNQGIIAKSVNESTYVLPRSKTLAKADAGAKISVDGPTILAKAVAEVEQNRGHGAFSQTDVSVLEDLINAGQAHTVPSVLNQKQKDAVGLKA
jgi:hypothetical protein